VASLNSYVYINDYHPYKNYDDNLENFQWLHISLVFRSWQHSTTSMQALTLVRRAKAAPRPRLRANPRFAIIHFIKPWSKHCMVPAGPWLCLQIVHTTLALRQGFRSPFPTLNDIDFIFSAYSRVITWVERSGNYMHLSEANFIEEVVKMGPIL
jgi:hypothetical protein